MPGISTGLKKKLTISACTVDEAGNIAVDNSQTAFEVLINPSSYKHQRAIEYNKKKTIGQAGATPRFNGMCPEKVTLQDIILDGTGVVSLIGMSDVKTMVDKLMTVIYKYVGKSHEPNYVRLLWGSLIFFCRAESIGVDYTLFKPSGAPLRAKVQITFVGWMSEQEAMLKANPSSPDLTHLVEVKAGDTLPLLCYRIYKDSGYYPQVARLNGITNFRDLRPGTVLRFPPLA
ncbi:CIS tube protein [Oxalicibacterium solurbis]|uniref:Contractile injection system tube protein N-terminal domain-containing protein n=1 Tax=Oxalicibacterium solurbis TaxID=69280 RepID=A0A8J3AWJ3_9BURK|nr:peptidoglycan-binding protein [Oxalicibacterium solurbis]GGI52866.1 hypothetical protein GCM10011430_00400 [Oxalicibacterium solurbis]